MKKLLVLLFILLCAVGFGFLMHQNPGYVAISYAHTVITTNLWVALALLLIAFILFYAIMRTLIALFSLSKRLARRKTFSEAQKYREYLLSGISDLVIGEYKNAEKYFLKSTEKNVPYINYLLAAKAAQAQNALDRRDSYLQKALSLADETSTFVVLLMQAQLMMQSDQVDAALVLFKSLHQRSPKNTLILSALKSIYLKSHAWESLKVLLPQLKKQDLISADELTRIKMQL